jgi:hypothetical protein
VAADVKELLAANVVLLVTAMQGLAQVMVSWPTQGAYRIGQYVAVGIEAPAARVVEVEAAGLTPLRIDANGAAVRGVFPMFVVDRPGETLTVKIDGRSEPLPMPLRAVGADERVVGVIGNVAAKAREIFGDARTVSIKLDAADPLSEPVGVWDVLDAVIIDGNAKLNEQAVRFLLAKGVHFAVRSPNAPDAVWPWKKDEEWWSLTYGPLGPRESVGEAAYAPVGNWSIGMLTRTRCLVIVLAVMFSIVVLGASLLRGTARGVAIGMVVLGAVLALGVFETRQPVLRQAMGSVVVVSDDFIQTDLWNYQTAMRETRGVMAWNGLTRPMVMSVEHAPNFDLRLVCMPSGRPLMFETTPRRGRVMCWRTSGVNPRTQEVMPLSTTLSPMRTVAQEFYGHVVGEGPEGEVSVEYEERWRAVIVEGRK